MASQPPGGPPGLGRGGRGAFVLAALQGQARRPGEPPASEGSGHGGAGDGPRVSAGRGAMLQSLMNQHRPVQPTPEPAPIVPTAPMGRGALLAHATAIQVTRPMGRGSLLAMTHMGSSTKSSSSTSSSERVTPSTTPVPAAPRHSYQPTFPPPPLPIEEMEGLQIGRHSGSQGKPMNLEVNYIKLEVKPGMGVFEYHVSFNPQVDSKDIRIKLMVQPNVKEVIGQIKLFDGMKLFLPHLLHQEVTTVDAVHPFSNTQTTLSIKYVGQNKDQGRIHLYNVLFRKIMNLLKLTLIGRNYFDPAGGIPVPQHKLQIWPGYVHAIQDYEGGLMLNCDVSFRVLRTATAKDLLYDAFATSKTAFQDIFFKQIIGCIVLTRYNNNTYRVDDVAWNMTPESSFKLRNGTEVTYAQYYKDSYGIQIHDQKQPLLIHRPKRTATEADDRFICLVPELCSMTGLTDEMRADFKVMKDIAAHTRVTPTQRQAALKTFCGNVMKSQEAKQILENWGLALDLETLQINGRMFDPEMIIVGRQQRFGAGREADWSRDLGRAHVLEPVDLLNWLVLVTKRDQGKAHEFVTTMTRMAPQMGIEINQPTILALDSDRTEMYLRYAKDNVHAGVQMVVFIFPTSRDDRYSAVKKLCCVEMPVPSQVINARTISQPQKLRSVTQKIALQINAKMGGELWGVPIPLKLAMICGVDVYHDPSRAGLSVLGFVASLNAGCTRWFSIANFQQKGQELGDCLRVAQLEALRKFEQVNHCLPSHIIFYRDGVGDGQMKHVSEYEVQQLENCFGHFAQSYNPKLTVIVVQKKINTKIFLRLNNGGRGATLDNPPPGTVVDHTVTRKDWFDFFLVSQHVRQGTVNPTHYVVVHNRSDLKPDHLQKLSYKLAHLYYNWAGTIRVPAPCQYAHKLAYLCGQNIHKEPHVDLCDKLFFL